MPHPVFAGRDAPRFVSCVCGWGAIRPTLRAANDAFFVHQLTATINSEHISHIEDAIQPGRPVLDR